MMKGQTIALHAMGSLVLDFLLLLGSSCTEEIIAEQQTAGGAASGDLVPVEFTVGDVVNLTRAASSIVTFNANEQVKVCVKPNGQSSYTGYTYTTASAGHSDIALTAPATPPYFPAGQGTSVEAYAYYPANAGTSFSVQADQRTDANYKASDLMFAANRTITKGVNDGSNSLLMNHLMAQLHLNVTGQGVSINRVLVNCKRSVTFTPEGQTVVSTTGSADDIIAKTSSGDAYVLIPQQPINTVTIKVETGSQNDANTTATFVFSYGSDFVAGKSYPLNLSVSATQVGITTSIADWDEMEAMNAELNVDASNVDPKKNPLWYVAQYDCNSSGGFETTPNAGYFFLWSGAMSSFAMQTTSYDGWYNAGKGPNSQWHLPTKAEWQSVLPGSNTDGSYKNIRDFDSGSGTLQSAYITPKWGYNSSTKAGISETSYWKKVDDNTWHAVRFIGTDYVSFWEYKWTSTSGSGTWSSSNYGILQISSTLIISDAPTTSNVSTWYSSNASTYTSGFGNDDTAGKVQRIFYARGYVSGAAGSSATDIAGTGGLYWSATEYVSSNAWYLSFSSSYALVNGYLKTSGLSVRLFRDN